MTNDETMARIEAALEILIDRAAVGRGVADQRVKVRALIRSKLPQPTADAGGWGEDDDRFRQNEEHERAVEAWEKRAAMIRGEINKERHYVIRESDIDEALRLMRARPAPHTFYGGTERSYAELVAKDEAAGELLRAAKDAWPWVYGHPKQSDELWQAIAKAERAGIKDGLVPERPEHQD